MGPGRNPLGRPTRSIFMTNLFWATFVRFSDCGFHFQLNQSNPVNLIHMGNLSFTYNLVAFSFWISRADKLYTHDLGFVEPLIIQPLFHCGWCVVALMRYLGIVWGCGYPRERVGGALSPKCFRGAPGLVTRAIAWGDPAD